MMAHSVEFTSGYEGGMASPRGTHATKKKRKKVCVVEERDRAKGRERTEVGVPLISVET